MEIILSFLDFIIGLMSSGWLKLSKEEKRRRVQSLFSFKRYALLFLFFLALMFYLYY